MSMCVCLCVCVRVFKKLKIGAASATRPQHSSHRYVYLSPNLPMSSTTRERESVCVFMCVRVCVSARAFFPEGEEVNL